MSRTETRGVARTILALLAAMLLASVLFSSGPGNGLVSAQTSPTTTCGAQIKWVNPDNDTATEISAEDDGRDERYHLVAWVNDVPSNAAVDFLLDGDQIASTSTSSSEVELVSGTEDTYEFFWDLSGIDDPAPLPPGTTSELEAVLYSGGSACSTDTEDVVINNTGDDPGPAAETVEIVDPDNGGEIGFYRMENGTSRGVFNVEASDGTTFIQAEYTITAPGSEPIWKTCGAAEAYDADAGALPAGDTVRCTLAAGDQPAAVTAVAAIANDSPGQLDTYDDTFDDSSDAHRVDSYEQVPSALTLGFEDDTGQATNGNSVTPDACSPTLVATVTDQEARPISGANVDVHAQGPTDSLKFSQVAGPNNTFAGPDKGTHTSEDASNCTGGAAQTQGEHDQAAIDIKHVESTAGTNDSGRFSFKMYHRTQGAANGTTQITAYADRDFNDVFCQDEPNADAAIGWGSGTNATATGLPPEQGSCPLGTPTPTPTPTTTASPTGTSSPTTTTTPTTTSPPAPAKRKVATNVSKPDYANNRFRGSVNSSVKRCQKGRSVKLKKHTRGKNRNVGRKKSGRSGNYKFLKRNAKGRYYVVAAKKKFTNGKGTVIVCRRDKSPTAVVK